MQSVLCPNYLLFRIVLCRQDIGKWLGCCCTLREEPSKEVDQAEKFSQLFDGGWSREIDNRLNLVRQWFYSGTAQVVPQKC